MRLCSSEVTSIRLFQAPIIPVVISSYQHFLCTKRKIFNEGKTAVMFSANRIWDSERWKVYDNTVDSCYYNVGYFDYFDAFFSDPSGIVIIVYCIMHSTLIIYNVRYFDMLRSPILFHPDDWKPFDILIVRLYWWFFLYPNSLRQCTIIIDKVVIRFQKL